jgi:hypothetical protein
MLQKKGALSVLRKPEQDVTLGRLVRQIISLHRDAVGKRGRGFLTGTLTERELLELGVSIGAVLGTCGEGTFIGNCEQ